MNLLVTASGDAEAMAAAQAGSPFLLIAYILIFGVIMYFMIYSILMYQYQICVLFNCY